MAAPDVSVIIATYQRREPCRAAIASALAQEPAVLEVIVADDGSTDGTREMLETYAEQDPRVRAAAPGPRAGRPAPARNRAIAAARGAWLAFLDDDDAWLPGKLERQLAHLDEADVVAANARLSGGGAYFPDPPAVAHPDRRVLLRGNPVIHSTALARTSLVREVGGFPQDAWLAGVEDYALWLALVDAGARFVVLGEELVAYADHGDARLSRSAVRNQVAVARLFWRRWRARPQDQVLRRAAFSKASYALTVARQAALGR